MKPLKFLDAYQREDFDIFFGRERETEDLYQKLNQSKLLLLYGLSGTGKTSVVRCGLANKFDPLDCRELYVRREQNIMSSLRKALENETEGYILPSYSDLEAVKHFYMESLRPVFLLFDQLEELFISGDEKEANDFSVFLSTLLNDHFINAKVLLIMREEYLANLDTLGDAAPLLFRNRLRLERMTTSKVQEVVTSIIKKGNYAFTPEVPALVVKNIQNENGTVDLPYLQVYLDNLFDDVAGEPVLNENLVAKTGKLKDILGDFLEDQLTKIKDQELAWKILKNMITPEATKKIVDRNWLYEEVFEKVEKKEDEFNGVLKSLVEARIVRLLDEQQLEIAHDSLGLEIAKKRTSRENQILECERTVRNKYELSKGKKKMDFLTADQLKKIFEVRSALRIKDEESAFILQSKRKVRTRKWTMRGAIGAVLIIIIGGLLAATKIQSDLRYKADQERQKAEHGQHEADSLYRVAKANEKKATANEKRADESTAELRVQVDRIKILNTKLTQEKNTSSENLARAQENERKETKARTKADSFRTVADNEKVEALNQANNARREKNKSAAIAYALQSTVDMDSVLRIYHALMAYDLNYEMNDNPWSPEVSKALILSNKAYSLKKILTDSLGIIDIFKLRNQILMVTGSGCLKKLDVVNRKSSPVWNDNKFLYRNNSAQYDSLKNELRISDINGSTRVFNFTVDTISSTRLEQSSGEDAINLPNGKFKLGTTAINRWNGNKYDVFYHFRPNQFSTGSLAASTKKNLLATVTQNGTLYLVNVNQPMDSTYEAQFQSPGTGINDIVFDDAGRFIATAGTDSKFRLNETKLIKEHPPIEISFNSWVTALFFVDQYHILIATKDGHLFQCDIDQDRLANAVCEKLKGITANPTRKINSMLKQINSLRCMAPNK